MAGKIYKGDIGTQIIIDMGTNIAAATTNNILVTKGDGSTATWDAEIYNDNYLRYTIVSDDLDVSGIYYLQPNFVFATWSGKGETVSFEVYESFK